MPRTRRRDRRMWTYRIVEEVHVRAREEVHRGTQSSESHIENYTKAADTRTSSISPRRSEKFGPANNTGPLWPSGICRRGREGSARTLNLLIKARHRKRTSKERALRYEILIEGIKGEQ